MYKKLIPKPILTHFNTFGTQQDSAFFIIPNPKNDEFFVV